MDRGWRVLILLGVAVVAACVPAPPATSPPPPPTAPTVVLGNWTATDGQYTFTGSVNPRGSPADVVLEYGIGPVSAPVYDQSIPVEEGMLTAAAVSATVELEDGVEFCVRFTATNEVGSGSSQPYCTDARPSNVIVVPPASDDPGASASSSP